MKIKTLLCALTVACALVAGQTMASSSLLLNVSAGIKVQNVVGDYKNTVTSESFNEKDVFLIISNALVNASANSGGAVASTNLPKGSYIVYNPEASDTFFSSNTLSEQTIHGKFYAEYKVGKTNVVDVPLSGLDTNGDYYSFMELDTTIFYADTNGIYDFSPTNSPLTLGFYASGGSGYDLFIGVDSSTLNKIGSGANTSNSKALLYIHDNPYDYGDPNDNDYDQSGNYGKDFYPFDDANDNAIEIGGIITASLTIKTNSISSGSLSLSGTGNLLLDNEEVGGIVSSGHASFTHYTP